MATPTEDPEVTIPRSLLRDAMTALYRASGDDTMLARLEPYAYPNEPTQYPHLRPEEATVEPGKATGKAIRTEPLWGLLTTFSVNLLNVPTHQHGPSGPHYITFQDAVNMLHDCMKAMGETP